MCICRCVLASVSLFLLSFGCAPTAEPVVIVTPEPTKPVPVKPVAEVPPIVEEEPDEETLVATRAIKENCLICHSVEIIETQRLTSKQWKAEIEKMVGWGSPLPVEQHESVIKFLGSRFADATARPTPAVWTLAEALSTIEPEPEPESKEVAKADLGRAEANFAASCKNCHGANGEGSNLGPNLIERPVLTRPTDFVEVVNKGRGRMPMLGTIVNKEASQEILEWLKTKRFSLARSSK